MTGPTPAEWLTIHASTQAALTSAMAPLFGNNPAGMAPVGFVIGFLTGLPVYVFVTVRRHLRSRR